MPMTSMPMTLRLIPLALLALTGCSAPILEDQITPAARNAPFPDLLPLETALSTQAKPLVEDSTDAALQARAAALRARARDLRRQYVP